MHNKEAGFSLVSVLVSLGLAAMVLTLVSATFKLSATQQRTTDQFAERRALVESMRSLLGFQDLCTANFKNFDTSDENASKDYDRIVSADKKKSLYVVGKIYSNGLLLLEGLTLEAPTRTADAGGQAILKVTIRATGKHLGAERASLEIPLVYTDENGKLKSCGTQPISNFRTWSHTVRAEPRTLGRNDNVLLYKVSLRRKTQITLVANSKGFASIGAYTGYNYTWPLTYGVGGSPGQTRNPSQYILILTLSYGPPNAPERTVCAQSQTQLIVESSDIYVTGTCSFVLEAGDHVFQARLGNRATSGNGESFVDLTSLDLTYTAVTAGP